MQYINPIVKNSKHPLKGNFLNAIERVLKLSVPTLYVWLCMFYCFFHLWLVPYFIWVTFIKSTFNLVGSGGQVTYDLTFMFLLTWLSSIPG